MTEVRNNMVIQVSPVHSVGTCLQCGFVCLFKPIIQVVLDRLLWSFSKPSLFLLILSRSQFLPRLSLCLAIDVFAFAFFSDETARPSIILLVKVNGAVTVVLSPLFFHDRPPLVMIDCTQKIPPAGGCVGLSLYGYVVNDPVFGS